MWLVLRTKSSYIIVLSTAACTAVKNKIKNRKLKAILLKKIEKIKAILHKKLKLY